MGGWWGGGRGRERSYQEVKRLKKSVCSSKGNVSKWIFKKLYRDFSGLFWKI